MRLLKPFAREITSILAVVIFLCAAAQRMNAQQTVTYPNFSSTAGLQLNGNATVPAGSGVLRLTSNSTDEVSSVWYTNPTGNATAPLPLSLGFTTTFSFQITNLGGIANGTRVGADGFAFVVQNGSFNGYGGDNTSGTSALGPANGRGGELGYTGLTNSVAVQFDTWFNSEYGDSIAGQGSPTSADEISVQSCGANANTVDHGAGCTFGRIDLSTLPNPIYIADGNVHTAQISYAPPTIFDGNCSISQASLGAAGCGSLTVIVDGQTVLTVPFNLASLTLDSSDDAYVGFTGATGGADEDADLLNWTFSANVVSVVSQPINTTTPPNLPATFSSGTGTVIQADIDFTTSSAITSPVTNPTLITINNAISQTSTWPQYVAGTPWAVSLCTIKAGNGGTDLCSLYVNQCFGGIVALASASDFYCPYVSNPSPSNYVTLKDTFDWPEGGKVQPLPGTTFSLIDFTPSSASEVWNASNASPNPVCTGVNGVVIDSSTTPPTYGPAQCDISDTLVDIYGDQTTTRGTKPKKGWLVSVYNVPMLTTAVEAKPNPNNAQCPLTAPLMLNNTSTTVWTNGACLLDFVVNPAVPPSGLSSTNNFQAAPPASLFYGLGAPAVVPGPPPTGDSIVNNPNPVLSCVSNVCSATPWDTAVNLPLSSLGGGLADGSQTTIHWSSKDLVGISEKNVQLINSGAASLCNNPDEDPALKPPCYNTNYFTTSINIDNTAPTISAAFSTPGSPAGTFPLNTAVYPIYTCVDKASGVANCGGLSVASCPLAPAAITSTTALNTSTVGPHSFNVTTTDCAGNVSQPLTVSYNVSASSADVALFEQETTDSPKHGTTFNYIVWALDITKGTPAYNTVITFQIPALGGISAGPITGSVADVSCSLAGCGSMPPSGGSVCATSTANSGATTVSCNVGTLGSVFNLTGATAKLSIPISSTAKLGSSFKINATVSSFNDPNSKNNSTADSITVK